MTGVSDTGWEAENGLFPCARVLQPFKRQYADRMARGFVLSGAFLLLAALGACVPMKKNHFSDACQFSSGRYLYKSDIAGTIQVYEDNSVIRVEGYGTDEDGGGYWHLHKDPKVTGIFVHNVFALSEVLLSSARCVPMGSNAQRCEPNNNLPGSKSLASTDTVTPHFRISMRKGWV